MDIVQATYAAVQQAIGLAEQRLSDGSNDIKLSLKPYVDRKEGEVGYSYTLEVRSMYTGVMYAVASNTRRNVIGLDVNTILGCIESDVRAGYNYGRSLVA